MGSSNRFDTSINQQYVHQNIPLPFEAIGNLGAKMQQTYDNNLAETYKLNDALSLVPAIHDPQSGLSNLKKKQDLDNEFHPKVEALTAKIMAGDPTAKQELKKLERDWINNPDRQQLESSYQNYKAYKEDKTKKGSKYDRLLDNYAGQQLIDPETGELKPFVFSGMDESLDVPKRFKEIMGDIAQDIKSWDVESLGADGIKIGNKGKTAGVDERKVNKVVDNKVSLALNTDEGRQFIKKLRKVNPSISEKEILDETRKQLFSSAYEQIGSEKMSGNSVDPTAIWSAQHQDAKEAKQTPGMQPWDMLIGQGTPESGDLNKYLENAKSNFTFDKNGNLVENLKLEDALKDKIQTGTIINPHTGNLNKVFKANTEGKLAPEYLKQQEEILSFLHNSGLYNKSKNALENYKEGIKLYGDAIKSGKLNAMSSPMFDATTSKAMEDFFIPKTNTEGNLTNTGMTNNWSIDGIDKNDSDGKEQFNTIVSNARIIGPDLSKDKGGNIWIEAQDGSRYSVNTGSKTLEDHFGQLASFTKKNNEAIFKPDRINQIKTLQQLITPKDGLLDKIGTNILNNLLTGNTNIDQQLKGQLEQDRLKINKYLNDLSNKGYKPINTYHDPQSNTLGISFIDNSNPEKPNIQVIEYQPGAEPTVVSDAIFNRDMYQKLFGTYAANKSQKSSSFTQTNLDSQKAK